FAEKLLSNMGHAGDTVVKVTSDDTSLSAYAVKQQNGHLDLLVINKSPSVDKSVQFNVTGFTPSGASTLWQYGVAQDTAQSQTTDGHSALAQSNPALTVAGGGFTFSFPRYSMSVLDLVPVAATATALASSANPA